MTPHDWAARYESGNTPWNVGEAHPELVARLGDERVSGREIGGRAFVPGCGLGHDAIALARAGFTVTAVDGVAALEETVRPALEQLGGQFVVGNALEYTDDEPFDLIWEQTFFSAIDPTGRPDWSAMVNRLLRAEGRFCAIAFPGDRPLAMNGPPWLTSPQDLTGTLGGGYRVVAIEPVRHRVPGRQWSEHWVELIRTAD